MTFALLAPHPDDPGMDCILPLVAANNSDANLAGFDLATQGRLTGLRFPADPDGILGHYLVLYNHNGPRLTTVLAASIEEAERILECCLETGIVEELEDF